MVGVLVVCAVLAHSLNFAHISDPSTRTPRACSEDGLLARQVPASWVLHEVTDYYDQSLEQIKYY